MPFGGLGIWEVLLILLVLLLVFGPRRLPELGGALGKGIREFKSSIREIENERSVTDIRSEITQAGAETKELNAPKQPPVNTTSSGEGAKEAEPVRTDG